MGLSFFILIIHEDRIPTLILVAASPYVRSDTLSVILYSCSPRTLRARDFLHFRKKQGKKRAATRPRAAPQRKLDLSSFCPANVLLKESNMP